MKELADLLIRINLVEESKIDYDVRWDIIDTLNRYIQSKQLTLTDVGKGTELLPDFLYKDDYGIKIGYHGDTEVSKEWNEYLEKIR